MTKVSRLPPFYSWGCGGGNVSVAVKCSAISLKHLKYISFGFLFLFVSMGAKFEHVRRIRAIAKFDE
jgi:hypothetical protein